MVVVERSYMTRPRLGPVGGLARTGQDRNVRQIFNREFIIADPPCRHGERRFVASFGVDNHKRLTVSLKDLKEGNRSYI